MFALDHATCSIIGAVLVKGPLESDVFKIDFSVYKLIDSAIKYDITNNTSVVSSISYAYRIDNGKRYAFYKDVSLTLPDGNLVTITFNRILGQLSYNLHHIGGVEYISINTTTYRILEDGKIYLIQPNNTTRPTLTPATLDHITSIVNSCDLKPIKLKIT
jgi:hypothetical protein